MEFIVQDMIDDTSVATFVSRVNARILDGYQPVGGVRIRVVYASPEYRLTSRLAQGMVQTTGNITAYSLENTQDCMGDDTCVIIKDASWIPQGESNIWHSDGSIWQAFVQLSS